VEGHSCPDNRLVHQGVDSNFAVVGVVVVRAEAQDDIPDTGRVPADAVAVAAEGGEDSPGAAAAGEGECGAHGLGDEDGEVE